MPHEEGSNILDGKVVSWAFRADGRINLFNMGSSK